MKIRQGFVSNSSSSSFVIGVAVVKDPDRLAYYLKEHKITEVHTIALSDIKPEDWGIHRAGNNATISAFDYRWVQTDISRLPPETRIAYMQFIGNEGDQAFYKDNDMFEIDYDIDVDFFDKDVRAAIDLFLIPGTSGLDPASIQIAWGAARNG